MQLQSRVFPLALDGLRIRYFAAKIAVLTSGLRNYNGS